MKLRVWYHNRVPSDGATHFEVKNIEEAKLVINTLAERDLKDDRITDNAMGLEVFEDGEWSEYENEEGDIDAIMKDK